jgi:hypothetical protein
MRPLPPFWENVDKTGDCWLWTASLRGAGYGQVRYKGKQQIAHRVAWILTHGPIPDGMLVRHKCDVLRCVRPDHLELGTHADNTRDMDERGRRGTRKLTDEQVQDIRKRLEKGDLQRNIAVDYNVTSSLISQIKTGRRHAIQ